MEAGRNTAEREVGEQHFHTSAALHHSWPPRTSHYHHWKHHRYNIIITHIVSVSRRHHRLRLVMSKSPTLGLGTDDMETAIFMSELQKNQLDAIAELVSITGQDAKDAIKILQKSE